MKEAVAEYRIGKAIVRIHPGKLTPEERKAVLESIMQDIYRAQLKAEKKRKMSENSES